MGRLVYVTGGARSGKSGFAEERAKDSGAPVTYLATMEAGDAELVSRIARHRARRPGGWQTVEEALEPAKALANCETGDTVLLDCISLWVSNRLFARAGENGDAGPALLEAWIDEMRADIEELMAVQERRDGVLIAVSNEVGLGIVPADVLSRYYRDALGLVNQCIARRADEATMLVSGLAMPLK